MRHARLDPRAACASVVQKAALGILEDEAVGGVQAQYGATRNRVAASFVPDGCFVGDLVEPYGEYKEIGVGMKLFAAESEIAIGGGAPWIGVCGCCER